MKNYRDLEGKINGSTDFMGVLSLGSVVLSGILLLSPIKAVGYIGLGTGIGTFTASVVTRKKHLFVAKQQLEAVTSKHHLELTLKDDEIVSLTGTVNDLNSRVRKLIADSKTQAVDLVTLQKQVEQLTNHNQSQKQLIKQVSVEIDHLLTQARTAVEESLDEWGNRLSLLVTTKREQYPKLAERLGELLDEGQSLLVEYGVKLAQVPAQWDGLADLLSLYYCVNDDLSNIKTKAVQAIARLSVQEKEVDLQEMTNELDQWQSAKLVPRDKLEALIKNYEAMLNEFRLDLNQRFESALSIASGLEGQVSQDEEFFLRLRVKIQQLEAEVHQLQEKVNH